MSDVIEITGIRAFGFHGVFAEEAERGQYFLVDVRLLLDLQRAAQSDDLADTVDYGAVADYVAAEVSGERVQLIERLAGRIAQGLLEKYPLITEVSVTVHKPDAPVNAQVADIAVTITKVR